MVKVLVGERGAAVLGQLGEPRLYCVAVRLQPWCSGSLAVQRGLKTYLIAGQRAKESHCSCSEALLSGFEVIDGSRVSSGPRGQGTASPGSVSDLAQTVKTFDNLK
ncbi:hypothetical protein J1605_006083, partial [Eschrichtius robustus]